MRNKIFKVFSFGSFLISICTISCSKNTLSKDSVLEVNKLSAVNQSNIVADAHTFLIPANKAYAEPYDPINPGVSIPVGYPEDKGVVSNWTNQSRSVVYYLYQTGGSYNFCIENTVENNVNLTYEVKISPCYSGINITPSIDTVVFHGTGNIGTTTPFKVTASNTGYYRYEIKPISAPNNKIIISNLVFNALQDGSTVHQTDYQSSPSTHISYSSTASTTKSYDWLYQELRVPTGGDALNTYYMAIGFFRGYLGMQTNSATERRVLFSVWDSKDSQYDTSHTVTDNVSLIDKEVNVTSNGFGNEGTGGQTYVNANWPTAKTISFIMNVRKESTNSILISAWYKTEVQSTWNYVATWRAPKDQRYFDGFYSFLENFGYPNGQMRREAEYFNAWGRESATGNWVNFNVGGFTNTDGAVGQRVDYEQGVSPSNSNRFYMSSGGYTLTKRTSSNMTLPLLTTPPPVNLITLDNRVSQALINSGTTSLVDGGIYKLVSATNNSSVIDVNSNTPVNGTLVSLWSANNPITNNQKYLVRKTNDGYYLFKSVADTTKVLDVINGYTNDGTQIQVYNYIGSSGQKWRLESASNGNVYIKSALSSTKSLDVNGGFTANGTKIQIWTSNTGYAQQFKLVKL